MLQELKKYYDHTPFEELHTHLLGMGGADFWLDFMMGQVLHIRHVSIENRKPDYTDHYSLLKNWYGPPIAGIFLPLIIFSIYS